MKKALFLAVALVVNFSVNHVFAVTLEQAVQSAVEKNESIAQSWSQLQQSEEYVRQIRGNIFPTLTLEGSYLRQPKLSDSIAANFFPEEQTTTNLKLKQPLFRGLREFNALDRQKFLTAAEKQTYLWKTMDIYQQVSASYLEILSLQQDVRNIESQQKIYRDRVRDLQGRARRGESSSTEALTAQSTAAALDADFQIQSSRLRSARENFAVLTGLDAGSELTDFPENETSEPLKPLADYIARVEERPDMQISKSAAAAAREDVSIAKGAHWPTVDFEGNYYLSRPKGFSEDLDWDVQLRATLPLFEGGTTQSKVRLASLQSGEKDLVVNQTRRKAEAEVKALHDSLSMRVNQLKALKLASDLSEKNYQTLLRESRRGLSRSLDVQLGLTEYRNSKRNYDQARYQARLDRIRLELAAGHIPTVINKEM
jgi:outer membrane protein